jgi:hypothetical protein
LPSIIAARISLFSGGQFQGSGHFRFAAGEGLISAILRRQSASDS